MRESSPARKIAAQRGRTTTTLRVWPVTFLLILCVFECAARAQMPAADEGESLQGITSGGMQSPISVDCSDPLLATSAQCYGQMPGTNQMSFPIMSPGATGISLQGSHRNYTDIEQFSRQPGSQIQPRSAPLEPGPLTEFQKFIASTTGQVLPIYGANLFRTAPSTFAPLNLAPVPPDYVIGPGDELRIRVWGSVNSQADVRVDRSGDIYLPQVGPVHVAGLPFSALEEHLRNAVGRVYHSFDLTADVGQIRAIQVYLTGAAQRPGVYTVSSLSTLVDTLFASGGPSTGGSLRDIQVRRGGAVVTHFDLYNLLLNGDKSKDVKLMNGDVIFIPQVGSQVAVVGSVQDPGIYELHSGESLGDALRDAGGVSAIAAEARVSIERIDNHRERHAMEVTYDEAGLNSPLVDGDLVRVFSIIPMYERTVILRGNTANPGRFAWHPGMRIGELIPDKESLLTRNYWWRRAQLGLPAPEFEPLVGLSNLRQPAEDHPFSLPLAYDHKARALSPPAQQEGGGEANAPSGETAAQGGPLAEHDDRTAGAPPELDQGHSVEQMRSVGQRTQVQILAPEIDWDYAVIERLNSDTLKTEIVSFDLGRLVLNHDASQNLLLQPGDVVTIFSEADIHVPIAEQTKLVRLDGEFVHAGVYSVQPGESLRQLVARAGGFTPNAYLYGSEFTRESTRAVQQARIDEYVRSMTARLQRGALALAASPLGSTQDLATNAGLKNGQQSMLAGLQQIRATGRIVLAFNPRSAGIDSIPDIKLENGDHFVVPSVPENVNVVGAVYDQSSFLYDVRRRTAGYLKLAGGPTNIADRKREFIIRADGEVISRTISAGPWGNAFEELRINPGDTIVVPEKLPRPPALREVLDWSQLFSQFALGAAALSVIQ